MRPRDGVVWLAEPGRNATLRIAVRIGSADDCGAVSDASDLGQDFALDTVVSQCRASCRVHLLRSQMPVISGNAIPERQCHPGLDHPRPRRGGYF